TNPQKIILHNFRTVSDHFELTKKKVAEIAGEEVANSLQKSIIEDKHRFLSSCAIAIRELFYTRGGFDIHR
ncbi:MAG: ROK family transcriptional regulator, partial [Clostridiales bacterium]|nr:ROK family transcriptional regulator [Clostridiales bacterium]